MTRFMHLGATVACIATAGMAAAQSSNDGSAPDTQNGKTPDELTCADIVTMDTAVVPGTLYYVAGYRHGSDTAKSDANPGRVEAMSEKEKADGTSGTGDTAGSDTGSASDTGMAADTGSTSSTDSTSDSDGANDSAGSTGSDTTAGSDASGSGDFEIARVSGFYEIPVEKVITVCNETPDKNVSDVLDENRQKNGGASGNSSDTQTE